METILLISGILTLLEKFVPKIKEWADGGNITKEQQDEIRRRYDALRADMDSAFGGDHWKVRPDVPSEPSENAPVTSKKAKSAKPTDGTEDCND